jgi:hypothetical protein
MRNLSPGGSMWNRQIHHWANLGSPLCPSTEDVDQYLQVITDWARQYGPPRMLLWGVTPELTALPLPAGTDFVSLDHNQVMIEKFHTGLMEAKAQPICGDWRHPPLRAGSRDLVIGDGCFSMVNYPGEYRVLARSLHHLLSETGICAFRFFLRPTPAESITDVVTDLRAGRIGSFHVFKRRAGIALQESAEQGIAVRRIWEWWEQSGITPEELTAEYGWRPETIATIDSYREGRDIFSFPTLDEVRAALQELLVEVDCHYPGYEFGESSPIIQFCSRRTP